MKILCTKFGGNPYPPIASGNYRVAPNGWIEISERCDISVFNNCGGFATLTLSDGIITAFTPDTAAWEARKAANPEQPTQPDPNTQTQIALAELAETESAHDLENKLALAELAEMIGGTNG